MAHRSLASKTGFQGDRLTRGDIEDWLADKHVQEASERRRTLRWAIIAAVVGIASALVGIAAIFVSVWLAK